MSLREAVVLAAGEGTRLRPLTRHRPKPMLPAANRPILEYVFDALIDAGIEEVCCVVGYKRDRVQDHFGSTYRDVPIEYVTQEKQLGSGHALLQAQGVAGERFLCVNGDQIAAQRIIADVMHAVDEDGDSAAVLAVLERDELSAYGAVTLEDGYVSSLIENPAPGEFSLLNAGVYALTDGIFDDLAAAERVEGVLTLPDVLGSCIADDDCSVRGVRTEGIWIDATYPWDLLTVARELLNVGWIEDTEAREGVWVSEDARVHESATLQAPVVVDADCVIGPEAVVGTGSALGRNVTVGANAVVQGSVLDADTRVGANATVIDSVTGQSVRADAGVTVPSGRADVTVAGEVHEDRRLGAVLADRVHAGGACSFAPGSLVGPGVRVRSGAHVSGSVTEGAEVVR